MPDIIKNVSTFIKSIFKILNFDKKSFIVHFRYMINIISNKKGKEKMMRTLCISALTASLSLMLTACGGATSGLSNAVTEPLNPHPKGVLSVELNESVPENGTLELTANGKTQTLQKGGKLDTGFLKTDKVSSYDYAQKSR